MTKWGEGKIERVCEYCGNKFLRYKAWVKNRNNRGGVYCSKPCQTKGRPKRSKVIRPHFCKECDNLFYRRKGNGGTNEYCSIKCMAVNRGRRFSKENHPNWKGGVSERTHEDRIVVVRAIRKIGKCERCGSTERLQGHHKKSYAKFPELRTDPSNIEVVCENCHAKEHPELEAFIRKVPHKERFEKICMKCGRQYKTRSKKSLFCSHICLFSMPPAMRKKTKWQSNG